MITRVNTIRRTAIRRVASFLILSLVAFMIISCQLGTETHPASTPQLPATPLPPAPPTANTPTAFEKKLQSAPRSMELTKVIDGYLNVRYLPPCEIVPSPAEWVAPIILTDMRSGSIVYLNRDGTLKESPKPHYSSEEGKATLESALKDSSILEQIVARPECPEIYRRANVGDPRFLSGLNGWPDHEKEDIGEHPMPKVDLSRDDPTQDT